MQKTRHSFKIGESSVSVEQYQTPKAVPTYLRLHDNETTAYQAAMHLLEQGQGMFINLCSNQQREIQFKTGAMTVIADPNRIFSSRGIRNTLKEYDCSTLTGERECKKFASEFTTKLIDPQVPVIALHNNFEDDFLISNFAPGQKFGKGVEKIHAGQPDKPHNLFYVNDASHFDQLAKKNFNAVLQEAEQIEDDGSFSFWCARRGIPYINIETKQGQLDEQINMARAALSVIL